MSMPPPEVCDRARQSKDARFDGLFFTGVRSTRIFCRPVCPAPTPKPQHIVYFPSSAAASAAGFRPCLRCRPELSPGTRPADAKLARALALIGDGVLQEGSVDELASRVALSPRHMRRLFADNLGATPLRVHQNQRLMLAKQLLTESTMPVIQVALAAGFTSLRRFNDAFKNHCGSPPTSVRRRASPQPADELTLRLSYRPPFDFAAALEQLRDHALPGVELVSSAPYSRRVSASCWIRISARPDKPELLLSVYGAKADEVPGLVRRARRMLDLDADMRSVHDALRADVALARSIEQRPGLRLVGAWDGFEAAVRELLQVDARAPALAHSWIRRLVETWGERSLLASDGLEWCFPTPGHLARAAFEDELGLAPSTAQTLRRLSQAVNERTLHFGAGQVLEDFVAGFAHATGAPARCGEAVALRAMGDPDAMAVSRGGRSLPIDAGLLAHSRRWRPWRAYALAHWVASTEDAMPGIDPVPRRRVPA